MLNISSTAAVSWPTPVATGVAPVTPVAAVQPAQASGGSDGQTQTGFGREGRAPQQRHTTTGRSGAETRTPAEGAPSALPRDPNTLPVQGFWFAGAVPFDIGSQHFAFGLRRIRERRILRQLPRRERPPRNQQHRLHPGHLR